MSGIDETVTTQPVLSASALDVRVDELWESLRGNPVLDRVFYAASELGDFSLLWHTVGWTRALVRPDGLREAAFLSAGLGAESAIVNGALKALFRRERPSPGDDHPHRVRTPKTSSFPSGHASSAMFAATVLGTDSRAAPFYFAVAAVVATSRIHVRMHHATDVAAGAAVGIALGRTARAIWRHLA